jgi:hypothetical protein
MGLFQPSNRKSQQVADEKKIPLSTGKAAGKAKGFPAGGFEHCMQP